ncbi:MAG: hypothetical protein E7082_07180 [Bacteroidales bacterium]|nr:hypothetical protein [Bacteroidales bacterium]
MSKSGFISSYVKFCTSGFGLGVPAAQAVGIAFLIVSIIFVIAFYCIKWIVQFIIRRNKAKKEAAANQPLQQTQQ